MAVGRHLEYCGCPQELHILENIQLFRTSIGRFVSNFIHVLRKIMIL